MQARQEHTNCGVMTGRKVSIPEGNVFCYFGPAWLVNFSMAADTEGSIGYNGGWGATEGPQGFFWGGTMDLCSSGNR